MKKIKILALLLLLSACGFEPMYVERDGSDNWYFGSEFNTSVTAEMEKVKVETMSERFGQMLRNELIDSLTPKGVPEKPEYRLYANISGYSLERQALRRDITATRESLRYVVTYYMVQDGKQLFKNDSLAYVSYDIMANPYSTTMAKKKAEEEAAKIIADDIVLRVGAYFHSVLTKGEAVDF